MHAEAPTRATEMVNFRPVSAADLDELLAIELSAYSHPWSRGNFADSLVAGHWAERLDDAAGALLGYFVALPGVQELHLLNLSVAPPWQRRGHGRTLLQRVRALGLARGDEGLWLEVRPSNLPAIGLYRQFGFDQVGLRRAYYPDADGQREDALVMKLALR